MPVSYAIAGKLPTEMLLVMSEKAFYDSSASTHKINNLWLTIINDGLSDNCVKIVGKNTDKVTAHYSSVTKLSDF